MVRKGNQAVFCEDRYYEKCRSFKYYNVEFNLVNYDKYEGSL